ncbi:5-(carboxyamino)imidazole ribonucleotide synthase [Paracoccus alkanivorans]|uniref:N5-carboxyaminoimidazole ribonucleotide synthase n=1 Tax=Paracoccus alkanivorans TaxID=2116655 RepID=A0A3M0MC10_9RHOB|nr:5-(carboxyamino)imidazole ribonucleotide synthase [Paracoccus alkanivorans]RMC33824.1 5-(carboxyamino)imidazole ribonucleotide synthase [Paracoccus alkanivorans]
MSEIRSIGILGGGQLGRMLSVAASRLGLRCHIYEPGAAPAGDVAHALTTAPYDDEAALRAFAESVDVITYEFENVPTSALDLLESIRPIRPNRRALAVSQDRLTEKTFLNEIGLATAPFADVPSERDLATAVERIGAPSILKTRRMGYDGKGQVRITDPGQLEWTGAPSVLEGFVDFSAEISVIIARAADGQVAGFDPGLNVHEGGILRTTTVPCGLPGKVTTDAVLIAARIANALDYVGVMGVELFVTPAGLIVNEIAPRVHNSGHWTQAGCAVDQFEQHIRAVAGLPLGDGKRHADVVMENLIGDDMNRVPELLASPRTQIHLYGKGEARPGRKMGHVNRITS